MNEKVVCGRLFALDWDYTEGVAWFWSVLLGLWIAVCYGGLKPHTVVPDF